MRRFLALVPLLLLGACSDGRSRDGSASRPLTSESTTTTTTAPSTTTTTAAPPSLDAIAVRLTEVVRLSEPIAMAVRSDEAGFYIAERGGRVVRVVDGQVTPILDISAEVTAGGEQGLLGLAFSPDGSRMYVSYTDVRGDSRLHELSVDEPDRRREILMADQPYANHNGGNILFGPDRRLYFGLGDGGSQGDPHDFAQNPDAVLGKILRIDPLRSGAPSVAVHVLGVRNPWRFSFDRATGDLWIGDVGGSQVEEIDLLPAGTPPGANLGWNRREGTLPARGGAAPPGAVPPIFEYDTSGPNCAVTGGFVYRGQRIPALRGVYLFGDYCEGEVRGLVHDDGRMRDQRPLGLSVSQLASFGEGADGELYALSLDGPVYRIDPA